MKALVEQYQRATGHLAQIASVYEQVYGHTDGDFLEIRSGMTKGVNRRYVPRHFWPLEVTGKDEQAETETFGGNWEGVDWDITVTEVTSRRGRWFRAAATTSDKHRDRLEEGMWGPHSPELTWHQQPLIGFDVSASQVQILAVFLGLDELEAQVTKRSHKEILRAPRSRSPPSRRTARPPPSICPRWPSGKAS